MKVYRVHINETVPKIEEMECVRTNDKSIFFEHNHVLRESWGIKIYDSYATAVTFSLKLAKRKIEGAKDEIWRNKRKIEQNKKYIKGLKGWDNC